MTGLERLTDDYGAPFGYPRIVGAYLAVNAMPDTWMLVDSADCATLRAEIIQDNHDWLSTLIRVDGKYRIASTGVCPHSIVLDRRESLAEQIAVVGQEAGAFLFVYPAPVTALVGIDYRTIVESVAQRMKLEAIVVDPVDSVGDWVSGYVHMMELVAKRIALPHPRPSPEKVALVGYLWDRNEADQQASMREVLRLVRALGLDPVCTWLSGEPTTDLARVSEAAHIIALPYAGRAATILSEKTGAPVVETGLPLGPEGTIRWLEQLGHDLGREKEAAALIESQAPELYRKLSRPVVRHFQGRDFMVCTEANLGVAVASMIDEFGGTVRLLATAGHSTLPLAAGLAENVVENGTMERVRSHIQRIADSAPRPPVLIASERGLSAARGYRIVPVPLGFQSGAFHHLYATPFLGFAGTLSLADRIGNAIGLDDMMG